MNFCKIQAKVLSFVIGRSFAEVKILKTRNRSYLLNRMEYFYENLPTHSLTRSSLGVAKCHLSLVEV